MLIITIVFILLKSYNFNKSIIVFLLCLIKCIEAFSETFYAIFQKNEKLYKSGISMGLKSLLYIIIFLIVDLITKNIIIALVIVSIQHVMMVVFYDIPNLLKLIQFGKQKLDLEKVKKILISGFFPFAISFLSLYVVNCPKYAIDSFLNENIQAIYGILVMPATITSLLSQFIIHPYLTTINNHILKNNYKEIINIIKKFIKFLFGLGIIILIGSYMLGIPLLNFVYNINLDKYKWHLIIIMTGAVFNGISFILSNMLIAMKKNVCQFKIYIVISVISFLITNILISQYSLLGACVSYLSIMILLSITFIALISIICKKNN